MVLNLKKQTFSTKTVKVLKKKKTKKVKFSLIKNTMRVFKHNINFFKKLENFKLIKENHFMLNFSTNNTLFYEIRVNLLQDFFLLKSLNLIYKLNLSKSCKPRRELLKPQFYTLDITNVLQYSNTQNSNQNSIGKLYLPAFEKNFLKVDNLLYVCNWYTILLHNYYTYRNTPGRTLGVFQALKSHFLSNKVFVATSVYPYGFKMIISHESSMLNKLNTPTLNSNLGAFNNLSLTGFSASIFNYLSSSNKINFLKKYNLKYPNFLSIIKRDKIIMLILKAKCCKFRKLRGVRLSARRLRRKFRKLRRKLRKFVWIRRKKYFLRKLKRFFRRKKRYLKKWQIRLSRQKFSIRIYKNKIIRLKIKRLLPLNKSGLTTFFSFVKKYNMFYDGNYTKSVDTFFNKNRVNIEKFQLFYKNIFAFFTTFKSAFFLKNTFFKSNPVIINELLRYSLKNDYNNLISTNLQPDFSFRLISIKYLWLTKANLVFKENLTPWVYVNLVQFIEFCSGRRVVLHLYSFMNQSMDTDYITLYKRWIPRLFYYERRLGHRFFLEEALHILHMSFSYRDAKLLGSWLGAIIKRISFWKTRFIFRFIKYLFNNYFSFILDQLGAKGFKVKLKGKISVAGNSRKRTILYRVGKTSHASCNLRVVHHFSTIVTFTGVQGFQVWIFY